MGRAASSQRGLELGRKGALPEIELAFMSLGASIYLVSIPFLLSLHIYISRMVTNPVVMTDDYIIYKCRMPCQGAPKSFGLGAPEEQEQNALILVDGY